MSTAELALQTQRFTKKFDDRELKKVIGFIEDILDARTYDRSVANQYPSVPGEEIEAYLEKKFALKFD